jgi:hypothetical protein
LTRKSLAGFARKLTITLHAKLKPSHGRQRKRTEGFERRFPATPSSFCRNDFAIRRTQLDLSRPIPIKFPPFDSHLLEPVRAYSNPIQPECGTPRLPLTLIAEDPAHIEPFRANSRWLEPKRHGHSAVSFLAGDVSHCLAGIGIENQRVGRTGNVKKLVDLI